ncbi:MAG: hypothetical protein ACRD0A_02615 [Acidimicrobiales bacterium]
MGQPITVVAKPSSTRPNIVRYEINRPLSGMGHERYIAGRPVDDQRPVDELARRLFERGGIDAIHINGSVITVDLAEGGSDDGLIDVIRELFVYYHEPSGVAQPSGEEAAPEPVAAS